MSKTTLYGFVATFAVVAIAVAIIWRVPKLRSIVTGV